MRKNRANETQEEYNARLQKMREYSASHRAAQRKETSEASRQLQREKEAKRKRDQRAKETPAQKEARLQKAREYQANRFGPVPEGGRKPKPVVDLRAYEREKQKELRERETPEQRDSRLQKAREYKASRKAQATPRERERTRERVAAYRAKRTDDEKKRDNEKAKLGMAKLKSNRSAPTWSCPKRHEEQCRVRKWRLLIAQGADAGPEPGLTGTKALCCHICDQDPDLPLAGIGRCPCYDCALLHGKVDEWMKNHGKKVAEWKEKCEKKKQDN